MMVDASREGENGILHQIAECFFLCKITEKHDYGAAAGEAWNDGKY